MAKNEKNGKAAKAESPAAAEQDERSFVVRVGGVMVGLGDRRGLGSTIKESELNAVDRDRFLADGTIAEV